MRESSLRHRSATRCTESRLLRVAGAELAGCHARCEAEKLNARAVQWRNLERILAKAADRRWNGAEKAGEALPLSRRAI